MACSSARVRNSASMGFQDSSTGSKSTKFRSRFMKFRYRSNFLSQTLLTPPAPQANMLHQFGESWDQLKGCLSRSKLNSVELRKITHRATDYTEITIQFLIFGVFIASRASLPSRSRASPRPVPGCRDSPSEAAHIFFATV
jgi:hypothetical protein